MKIEEANHSDNPDIDDQNSGPAFAWPSVVAVVVAHNPGEWLEECLTSLNNEDYPDLTTLVLDVNSEEEIKDRVSETLPSAFVKRTDDKINFAKAVNIAVDSIEGATYVLICHDDVIIKRGAIALMVEEAFRSNASIVGPKILDAQHPSELIEVGGMIDRFGVPFSGIEPEEVDQGQHDGIRDVFYASSATMLVRADLFRALEGFDEKCFPGAEDIDLAWRAHLLGARVLVQPDAVVYHHRASDHQRKSRISSKAIVARHRMRAVVKNSSKTSLFWILPLAFLLHSIEGIVWLFKLNPGRSATLFSGWLWNLKNIRELLKTRKQIQKTREVPDRVISRYQIAGSARVRKFITFFTRNRQLKQLASASKSYASQKYANKTSEFGYYFAAVVVYLIAARSLIFSSIPAVGNFTSWPNLDTQINALLHGGFPVGSEPAYSSTLARLVSILLTALFLGNSSIAQIVFILSLLPIGALGIKLLMRDRGVVGRSNTAGVLVYVSFGLGIFAFSQGGIDSLILIALIPYLLKAFGNGKLRQAAITTALMVAFVPSAITLIMVLAFAFSIVGHQSQRTIKEGSLRALIDGLKFTITAIAIGLIVNIGIIVDSIKGIDRSLLGLSDASLSLEQYIFPNTSTTVFTFITAAITLWALMICRNEKVSDIRVLVVTFGLLFSVAGYLVSIDQPLLDSSVQIALLQLICALSVGVCLSSYFDEMKQRSFGLAHIGTALSVLAVFAISISSGWVLKDGNMGLPQRSWSNQLNVEQNSRVLYLGNSKTVPGRSVLAPLNRSFMLSAGAQPSILTSRVGPATSLDDEVRAIYSKVMARETQHSGRMFARLGIEAIVIPTSIAPGQRVIESDAPLLRAFDTQTDLIRLGDREGLVVYVNSELNESFGFDQRARDIELAEVVSTVESPETELYSPGVSLMTLIVSAFSIVALSSIVLWPRRKRLLAETPILASKMTNKVFTGSEKFRKKKNDKDLKPADEIDADGLDFEEKSLDLSSEHKFDEIVDSMDEMENEEVSK